MTEMIHFIRQTQAYCQVEVIECSWEALYQFIQQKKGDLDSLIGAHRSYLDRIVKKILLISHKMGREASLAGVCSEAF
jgi:gamma-tubulin complex component 3